jgi:hypothetical protein
MKAQGTPPGRPESLWSLRDIGIASPQQVRYNRAILSPPVERKTRIMQFEVGVHAAPGARFRLNGSAVCNPFVL